MNTRQKTVHNHFYARIGIINSDVSGLWNQISGQVWHFVHKFQLVFICGAAEKFKKKNKTNKQKNNPENNDQPNLKSVTKHKQPRVLYRLKSTYHESK